ncbi:hypothetical protein HAX54_024783, partial [Datura stramonium]|nr:hypothetical protein [Datura stramonium]
TMESKGKEVNLVEPSLKRTTKGNKGSSSSASKAGPVKEIWSGQAVVEHHGLTWFNSQKTSQ